MNKRFSIYLYTFFGVAIAIFLIGFVGINVSLKYIQDKYIHLQIDVNKRQAERMRFYIESQIKKGVPLDTIRTQFQTVIIETANDEGFLCMYDVKEDHLVCHPNKDAIGVKFNKEFTFRNPDVDTESLMTDIYKQGNGAGGIFTQSSLRTDIIYTVPVRGTNWFINAHENISAISAEIKLLRFRYILGSLILGLLIAIAATVTARKISRRYEKQIELKNEELDKNYKELKILHDEVNQQKNEIEKQRDFVLTQRDEIAQKNKQITDSINYALRIQTAVLPSREILNDHLPKNFILYKPKDIVSGDFYWFTSIDKQIVVVAADCTGHGVPGAFMSMLGVTLLNEIINNRRILQPDLILNELRTNIKNALGQTGSFTEQKDGMDISLCIINLDNLQLQFAGAYNSLYLVRKNADNFELQEIKADHMPIGVHPRDNVSFTNNQLQLLKDDSIYLFSDGYVSQFGGDKGDKFKAKRLQQLLLDSQKTEISQQKNLLDKALTDWQGTTQQVDDIMLIGIQI